MVTKAVISSTDKRLGRQINHDSRSLNYTFNTKGLKVISTVHSRHIGILDQGQVGSCTGNAGIGALATDPLFQSLNNETVYALNETGALKLYSDAETIDGDGPYPPQDNGSSGLSIAKALKKAGIISSYQHAFDSLTAITALSQHPFIFGTYWYNGMFTPDADGRVHLNGSIAGGHEILCREVDAVNQRLWFDNSWGTSWGVNGRFYLTFADFDILLKRSGDVIIFIPSTITPPTPSPVAVLTDDQKLAVALRIWLQAKGYK